MHLGHFELTFEVADLNISLTSFDDTASLRLRAAGNRESQQFRVVGHGNSLRGDYVDNRPPGNE